MFLKRFQSLLLIVSNNPPPFKTFFGFCGKHFFTAPWKQEINLDAVSIWSKTRNLWQLQLAAKRNRGLIFFFPSTALDLAEHFPAASHPVR